MGKGGGPGCQVPEGRALESSKSVHIPDLLDIDITTDIKMTAVKALTIFNSTRPLEGSKTPMTKERAAKIQSVHGNAKGRRIFLSFERKNVLEI